MTDLEMLNLESMIDKYGIDSMLVAISNVCGEKAVHIAENWQDARLAKRWSELSLHVDRIVPKAKGL